ncbi:MAG: Na+/H+ antiporter subunit D, partial [Pelagerythrobacter marensis]
MSIGSVPLTDLAPLAVMIPVLGAAVTFMLVRRPRAQITVTVTALVLTLLLNCLLLADVW